MIEETLICGRCRRELPQPQPARCPHCGAQLGGSGLSLLLQVFSLLAILALFAAMVGFVVFLAT